MFGDDRQFARPALPELGRILGIDKVDSAVSAAPQSWSRYGYGLGSSLR